MSVSLQEPTFLILTALAAEPMHGYGVIQEVATLSDGRVTLRPGTLYGALDRLVEQNLTSSPFSSFSSSGPPEATRITEAGATVLESEAHRLTSNAEAAVRRLRGRGQPRGRLARG